MVTPVRLGPSLGKRYEKSSLRGVPIGADRDPAIASKTPRVQMLAAR